MGGVGDEWIDYVEIRCDYETLKGLYSLHIFWNHVSYIEKFHSRIQWIWPLNIFIIIKDQNSSYLCCSFCYSTFLNLSLWIVTWGEKGWIEKWKSVKGERGSINRIFAVTFWMAPKENKDLNIFGVRNILNMIHAIGKRFKLKGIIKIFL